MSEKVFTVSELNGYIKRMMDFDTVLSGLWIKGEISNFKNHTSGHMYMSLKDSGGAIRAVMFKSAAVRLRFMPEDGMKVLVFGRVSVFESAGQYQIYIEAMQPDGVGALYVAFEQLKEKLSAEGLFDQVHKKSIPAVPKKIAVVTSPTGAAIRDILNVLNRRFPYADVLVCPVLVQGDGASHQIASAIEYVNAHRLADVLIVGRGGGSIEDLWAFNEEICARAIFASQIPVISAVGHETDFTIADLVADLRAPTPSAAAELAVPSTMELLGLVRGLLDKAYSCVTGDIERAGATLRLLESKLSYDTILRSFDERRLLIDSCMRDLEHHTSTTIARLRQEFVRAAASLDSLSPLRVLSRGYSLTCDENGKPLRSVDTVACGDKITTILQDGKISASVLQTERNLNNG